MGTEISAQLASSLIPVIDSLQKPWELQAFLLYGLFTVHLLLVNIVLGVAIFSLADRIFFANNSYEQEELRACSILLPKGTAFVVNLAIPPLLFLQGIYGQFIYTSSILIAVWWLSIMIFVIFAYYGLYIHMTANGFSYTAKTTTLALSILLLCGVAFILVNNVTLMSSPTRWGMYAFNPHGTSLNLGDPQVIPRFLHIFLASLAIGGLSISAISHWRKYYLKDDPDKLATLISRSKRGLRYFFYATLLQIPTGLWFLLSLPNGRTHLFLGQSPLATTIFIIALTLAGLTLYFAWNKKIKPTLLLAVSIVFLMSFMRTLLRESLLSNYYAPSMRPFEAGSLIVFSLALVASLIVLIPLIRLYLKRNDPKVSAVFIDTEIETENDTVLINEMSSLFTDLDEMHDADEGRK